MNSETERLRLSLKAYREERDALHPADECRSYWKLENGRLQAENERLHQMSIDQHAAFQRHLDNADTEIERLRAAADSNAEALATRGALVERLVAENERLRAAYKGAMAEAGKQIRELEEELGR